VPHGQVRTVTYFSESQQKFRRCVVYTPPNMKRIRRSVIRASFATLMVQDLIPMIDKRSVRIRIVKTGPWRVCHGVQADV
jgi:hypothetical protein